jgi:hypothetical protein
MPEIGTSGSMSEDGKRSVAKWPKLPRLSSTLPKGPPVMSAISAFGAKRTSLSDGLKSASDPKWAFGVAGGPIRRP